MDAPSDSPVNLKHRLTGAIILLLMPILLLPWWLDTSAVPQREREAAAAFQPNSDFVSALESPKMALTDSRGEGATEIITTSESGSAAGAPMASPNPASETLHDSTAGVLTKSGWFVQVGAFKQIENLEQREARLAENGISSIREKIKIGRAHV